MHRLLALALLPAVAAAVEVDVPWQARVSGATGPYHGDFDVTITLYEGSTPIWQKQYAQQAIQDGYVGLVLSGPDDLAATPLDSSLFAKDLLVGVQIGTDPEMSPRMSIGVVPRAASVVGTVVVGDVPGACTVDGTLRLNAGELQVCISGGWQGIVSARDGSTPARAGTNCADLRDRGYTTSSWYWIDPNGDGAATRVYCDQTHDAGGWNVCAGLDPYINVNVKRRVDVFTTAHGTPETDDGTDDASWSVDCDALAAELAATEVIFTSDSGDWWSVDAPANLATFQNTNSWNSGTLNDTTTGRSVSAGNTLTSFSVDWDGSCTYGTGSHEWHVLSATGGSCGAPAYTSGGVVFVVKPDAYPEYRSHTSCGDSAAERGDLCDNVWIRLGVR